MERIIVDQSGSVTIPPLLVQRLGLRPGDEMNIVETEAGWSLYLDEVDPTTLEWWAGLSKEERRQAAEEANRYEALSEEERDAIWNQFDESLENDDEEDDTESPIEFRTAGNRAA